MLISYRSRPIHSCVWLPSSSTRWRPHYVLFIPEKAEVNERFLHDCKDIKMSGTSPMEDGKPTHNEGEDEEKDEWYDPSGVL